MFGIVSMSRYKPFGSRSQMQFFSLRNIHFAFNKRSANLKMKPMDIGMLLETFKLLIRHIMPRCHMVRILSKFCGFMEDKLQVDITIAEKTGPRLLVGFK